MAIHPPGVALAFVLTHLWMSEYSRALLRLAGILEVGLMIS